MMPTITQPLRDEHRELVPHIDALRTVADGVGDVPLVETRRGLDEAYLFLTRHLIPHAQAEDSALYPVVAQAMGAPEATAGWNRFWRRWAPTKWLACGWEFSRSTPRLATWRITS